MNQGWISQRSGQPAGPRKRTRVRKNKYGRRGPGNRCGYNPANPVRPKIARNLPPHVYTWIAAFEARGMMVLRTALDFRFESRAERDEAMLAVVTVMLAATDVLSKRIGRPSKTERGRFEGLSVDYDLSKRSGIGESRVERVLPALKDHGWHYWHEDASGRRCARQPVERDEDGSYRGRAAIRQWTPLFFRDIGISETSLKAAAEEYRRNQAKQAAAPVSNVTMVPVDPIVDGIIARLYPRERPPP